MSHRVLLTMATALGLGLMTSSAASAYDGWDGDEHRYQHRGYDRDDRSGHRGSGREYGSNHRDYDDGYRSWRRWHGGHHRSWSHRFHAAPTGAITDTTGGIGLVAIAAARDLTS
jgi:hypothetical protein